MLHWKVKRGKRVTLVTQTQNSNRRAAAAAPLIAALLAMAAAAGCGKTAPNASQASPKPSASASPTPFPVSVKFSGAAPILFDARGQRIAEMKAGEVLIDPKQTGTSGKPTDMDIALDVAQGTMTLYREGKPSATLSADRLHADKNARTVIGSGNVVARSLAPDAPSIRADTMTWSYDKNQIVGSGHVLVTRAPNFTAPGSRFTADTGIRQFTLYGSAGAPATGSF